jgi:CBS domain containing-hemolysin-like protein
MVIGLPLASLCLLTPLEGSIAPAQAALSFACLLLASIGAHAGAALLVYSPTKLGKLSRRPGDRVLASLQNHENEYQVLARILSLGGITTSLLLAVDAAQGALGFLLVAAIGVLALLACSALPAAFASHRAEQFVAVTVPFLRVLHWLLRYPLLVPLVTVAGWILRAVGVRTEPTADSEELAEEIVAAVSDSVAEGQLDAGEREWISNIVELKELRVSEVMTPRTDVEAFQGGTDLREAVSKTVASGHSRYPVYEESIDKIVGVFYAKDALSRLANGTEPIAIRSLLRKPLFVPESMRAIHLLEQFKATRTQLAIVLDEYGGTAGVVTIEDILEEIVGDISDEYDLDEEETIKVVEKDKIVEITGRARVDEVNAALGTAIPEDAEYDTLAGLVFNRMGRVPEIGDCYRTHGVEITVLAADDRRISRLRVTVLEPQPSES